MNWVKIIINQQEVSVAFDTTSIHIYNAFPIKDDLKLRGYRWNPTDKSWYSQPDNIELELAVLKNNLHPLDSLPVFPTQPPTRLVSELATFPDSLSISELRNRIDKLIRDGLRGNIWVRGIVASAIKHYKWASYFDLRDEDENHDMFFRVEVKKQPLDKIIRKLSDPGVAQDLEKDLPLFCNVDVHLPSKYGVDIRLNLLDILPEYTQAKIRNQREITLEILKNEGLLELQKRLTLPTLISRIGLITSAQGTSIQDINAGLHPYNDKYQVYFVDARMEGNLAVENILHALEQLENHPSLELDAIIIARGGGSEQSLAVFNDLRICRKVCQCRIPIITAIGHEKDLSAIEICSWLTPTPSTPSGIGKYLQNHYLLLQSQLSTTITRLIHRFTTLHQREIEKLYSFLKHIPARVTSTFKWHEQHFFSMTHKLEQSVSFTVRDQERRITDLSTQLNWKIHNLHTQNHQYITHLTGLIISRTRLHHQRESTLLSKTIRKLDFAKRDRHYQVIQDDIARKAQAIIAMAGKTFIHTLKDIETHIRLVQASDPQLILKKGFTLTLDLENNVIQSVQDFKHKQRATLRFHDGTAPILADPNHLEESLP